ncbi:erythroid membrane-associated protein [Elephas maximus indicus]|uniref:erythroid membrane-associated protein n=1 Tax=Elephas maximus indicus TaxID=99487 RepID=UPI002115DD47|nr:erythroid membrane-associated protein [Elephas maximus indicus]
MPGLAPRLWPSGQGFPTTVQPERYQLNSSRRAPYPGAFLAGHLTVRPHSPPRPAHRLPTPPRPALGHPAPRGSSHLPPSSGAKWRKDTEGPSRRRRSKGSEIYAFAYQTSGLCGLRCVPDADPNRSSIGGLSPPTNGGRAQRVRLEAVPLEMASFSGSWLSGCLITLIFLQLPAPGSGDARKFHLVPLGGTAELPCPLPLWPSMEPTEVRWLRSPHPQLSQAVHVFRSGKDWDDGQMPEYKGRTVLVRDTQEGNVTLKILNVRLEDQGQYRCQIQIGNLSKEGSVTLQVAAPSPGRISSPTVALAVMLPVLGLLFIAGIFLIWKQRRSKEKLLYEQAMEVENLLSDHAEEKGRLHKALKKLRSELKLKRAAANAGWRRAQLHFVAVTLDPDTAHPKLILSGDRRCVRLGDRKQPVPDNPQRFDFVVSVLGSECFTAGCHYWEVYVGDKTKWILGVCSESVSRKGKVTASPSNGHWLVRQSRENHYEALTSPQTSFRLKEPPLYVGIFLDYEAGIISFFNVTDKSHIFTFTHSFSGPLRPFFEPCLHDGGKNLAPLVICSELHRSEESTVPRPERKSHANGDVSLKVDPSLFPPPSEELFPLKDLSPALQGLKVPSF